MNQKRVLAQLASHHPQHPPPPPPSPHVVAMLPPLHVGILHVRVLPLDTVWIHHTFPTARSRLAKVVMFVMLSLTRSECASISISNQNHIYKLIFSTKFRDKSSFRRPDPISDYIIQNRPVPIIKIKNK